MRKIVLILISCIFMISCGRTKETSKITMPAKDWIKDAVIYEVNVRQYTEAGTFKAFEGHLPRLQKLGVNVLWFMPIYPISEKNRKGTLGSYYAITDYTAINPEFGTLKDFKQLVNKAHSMGFIVILDWVANHTGWDSKWITDHPDWYLKNDTGAINSPFDWTDVAELNYDNNDMRSEMIKSMRYWVEKVDIDGFRCDVAAEVPTDFWEEATSELNKVKPVFMLAEANKPELCNMAFKMDYAWDYLHIANAIAKGEKTTKDIFNYLNKIDSTYNKDAIKMYFTTNHDENSWNGTVEERYGKGSETYFLLATLLPGMPLIYSGQERGLKRRLKFFDKDLIDWNGGKKVERFYSKVIGLKKNNEALYNGHFGGSFKALDVKNDMVFACQRIKNDNDIIAILNLSDKAQDLDLRDVKINRYKVALKSGNWDPKRIAPFAYFVFIK